MSLLIPNSCHIVRHIIQYGCVYARDRVSVCVLCEKMKITFIFFCHQKRQRALGWLINYLLILYMSCLLDSRLSSDFRHSLQYFVNILRKKEEHTHRHTHKQKKTFRILMNVFRRITILISFIVLMSSIHIVQICCINGT